MPDYFQPHHPRHKTATRTWMCAVMMTGCAITARKAYLYVLRGVWDL